MEAQAKQIQEQSEQLKQQQQKMQTLEEKLAGSAPSESPAVAPASGFAAPPVSSSIPASVVTAPAVLTASPVQFKQSLAESESACGPAGRYSLQGSHTDPWRFLRGRIRLASARSRFRRKHVLRRNSDARSLAEPYG